MSPLRSPPNPSPSRTRPPPQPVPPMAQPPPSDHRPTHGSSPMPIWVPVPQPWLYLHRHPWLPPGSARTPALDERRKRSRRGRRLLTPNASFALCSTLVSLPLMTASLTCLLRSPLPKCRYSSYTRDKPRTSLCLERMKQVGISEPICNTSRLLVLHSCEMNANSFRPCTAKRRECGPHRSTSLLQPITSSSLLMVCGRRPMPSHLQPTVGVGLSITLTSERKAQKSKSGVKIGGVSVLKTKKTRVRTVLLKSARLTHG